MAENKEQITLFRKILVAVDTSSHSQAALEAAVTLAKISEGNVSGIFVHEAHWTHLGKLSSSSMVNAMTGRSETIEAEAIQEQVDQLANRLRRHIARISRQNAISHSWHMTSGKASDKILEAAENADLITIGRRSRSISRENKLGSTARNIIQKSTKPVLILNKGLHLGNTVTVVYNGTTESQRGLKMALHIADKNNGKLSILVTKKNENANENRDKTIEEMTENSEIPVDVHFFHQVNVGRFLNAIHYRHPGVLIIPKNQSFLQGNALEITLEHIHCPVLLMT